MIELKNRFEEFQSNESFSLVNPTHFLDIYIGLDVLGRKSIKLRGVFKPVTIKEVEFIEIIQRKIQDKYEIIFALKDNSFLNLFCHFCQDLVEVTEAVDDSQRGYTVIISQFLKWKKLFATPVRKILTEPQIMGLIGELYFLKTILFEKYDYSTALNGWGANELLHKDFSYANIWYEVKTNTVGSQSIKISSIEQLEASTKGFLILYVFEKMSSEYDGVTLNSLILEIHNKLDDWQREVFFSKLNALHYAGLDEYDDYVYSITKCIKLIVNQDFPKISRKMLPTAVSKAQYELSLIELDLFIVDTI